jgi:hypothetical protein
MKTMNMPGFTAEASLRTEEFASIYHAVLQQFETLSGVVPAMSCSSRDHSTDCFCSKGCRRTSGSCDCPND